MYRNTSLRVVDLIIIIVINSGCTKENITSRKINNTENLIIIIIIMSKAKQKHGGKIEIKGYTLRKVRLNGRSRKSKRKKGKKKS